MSKVAIVTDSNSGITQKRGEELGIYVLPMPFFIDGELYLEDITLSQEQFYEKLGADSEISTSQPSPGDVMDLWDKLLEDYDEIVCIPMSSGLSSTCETALSLAQDYDEKVQVVNNQRISVTQEQSVYDAIKLRDEGKSAAEIRQVLEKRKNAGKYLYHSRYVEVSEKGWKNHSGSSSYRNGIEFKAGSSDPGREAGCICKSQRLEGSEEDDAQCH